MDNYCVPDFQMDEDYTRVNKQTSSTVVEEDSFMELLWQNGQVVAQSQRSERKPQETQPSIIPNVQETSSVVTAATEHLFMQEDEMTSWLHSPLDIDTSFDHNIDPDQLFPTLSTSPPSPEVKTSAPEINRQPPPPVVVVPRQPETPSSSQLNDFMHFARMPRAATMTNMVELAPSSSNKVAMDFSRTPVVGQRRSRVWTASNLRRGSLSGNELAAKELTRTYDLTTTSPPGGAGSKMNAEKQQVEDRKQKGKEPDDSDDDNMDLKLESGETKKQSHGSRATKRSRAAEVHNLSERRRRDRINEKMKALQELVPRCNKLDKASMLDDAIEYLKALQMQVQMMTMGCTMVPMMYPGVQQYMPAMGMGMGMGMSMGMGMNCPMVPYPGSAIPNPVAHMGPTFPMEVSRMPQVPIPDPSRIQTSNTLDPMINTHILQNQNQSQHANFVDPMINTHILRNQNQSQHANFVDPYQQYLSLHQEQVSLPQNELGTEKPGCSREVGNPEI